MQGLADRLGVKRAALHRHFPSREALIAAVGEHVLASFQPKPIDAAHWREWLSEAFVQLIDFMHKNPFVLALRSWDQSLLAILPFAEAAAETLVRAGFSEEEALHLWRMIHHYAYSAACSIEASPRGEDRYRTAARFSATGKYPHLAAALPKVGLEDPIRSFSRSMEWLLSELAEPRTRKSRKAKRK